MKYQPIFKQLRDQPSTGNTADAVPQWLNTACNSPSFHASPPPFTTSSPTSPTSPPATPPHLRKRRKQRDRRPLQPSNDNQKLLHKPLPKRKMADRDDDTIEQSGRQLRSGKNMLKPPVKYQEEEQGPPSQRTGDQVRRSPHKSSKSEGVAIVSTRGLEKGTPQSALQPSIPQPTTPVGGRSRGSGGPEKRQKSPTKSSSHASDRMGWMAHLDPNVRFLIPQVCLKQRKVPNSVFPLWLNHIRSDANGGFIPEKFLVSNSIFVL